ncbi:MAG: methyltransferase, partial [Candidatus Cloacimonadaceae bacterium]|jgi:methylase of polypeptide subunit release factors
MKHRQNIKLYHSYAKYVTQLRSNPALVRHLFGFTPPKPLWGQYWDWTTIALRDALRRYLKPDLSLLDMGCGPYAVLSRFAKEKLNCRAITGADHCQELVDYAQETDPDSGIAYLHSDLFENISGKFDLIIFNAPYVEAEKGTKLGLFPTALDRKRFSGGEAGADTIARFLQAAPKYLRLEGKLLLGVNHYHIGREVVQSEIFKSGFKTVAIHHNPITKACVYVLKEKENEEMPKMPDARQPHG